MAKDAFYFAHDTNAIQDPKMITLLTACGTSGIGMYWILIEMLHQQPEGKITQEEYKNYLSLYLDRENKGSAFSTSVEQMLIKSGLLLSADGFVYSERVLRNKKIRDEISEKRSEAGKKSSEIRRNSKLNSTSVEHVSNKCSTKLLHCTNKGKERKGNKRKEKKDDDPLPPTPQDLSSSSDQKDEKLDGKINQNIYQLYEQEIGTLTAGVAAILKDAETEYSAPWIAEAIKIAALNNKRSWSYIKGILDICKTENHSPGNGFKKKTGPNDDKDYLGGKYGHVVQH